MKTFDLNIPSRAAEPPFGLPLFRLTFELEPIEHAAQQREFGWIEDACLFSFSVDRHVSLPRRMSMLRN
ncbi:hypothetical protein NKH82_12790 [Mesorhizobium sp. M0915]|uniref:hypothetical protein n=1 Tax=unclassified Mesorhizobium TaxID=325217 RepID=UPI003338D332